MGFGSYDEDDRQTQNDEGEDDGETVNMHENEHKGKMEFDSEASTSDLVSQLQDIKDSQETPDDE